MSARRSPNRCGIVPPKSPHFARELRIRSERYMKCERRQKSLEKVNQKIINEEKYE